MNKKKKFGVSSSLSKGLTEAINIAENSQNTFRNAIVSVSRLELDPDNPRHLTITLEDVVHGINPKDTDRDKKQVELQKLTELAHTIKDRGLINPIVVYKRGEKYRVVAGERRTLASILAKKTEIEARIYHEKPDAFAMKVVQWLENTAREDLSLSERIGNLEDIIQYHQKVSSGDKLTQMRLAEMTGLSNAQISNYMTIITAPADIKSAVNNGLLQNLEKAAWLAKLADNQVRQAALEACIAGESLNKLKNSQQKKRAPLMTNVTKRRGREARKITLGSTSNIQVAKFLFDSAFTQTQLQRHKSIFADVNWQNFDSANQTFKKFIQLLESEINS